MCVHSIALFYTYSQYYAIYEQQEIIKLEIIHVKRGIGLFYIFAQAKAPTKTKQATLQIFKTIKVHFYQG